MKKCFQSLVLGFLMGLPFVIMRLIVNHFIMSVHFCASSFVCSVPLIKLSSHKHPISLTFVVRPESPRRLHLNTLT